MGVYERYCDIRDKMKIRDADVAKGTGIGKSTFTDWKTGRSVPKQDKLQKIADFLCVSIDYLMNGNDSGNSNTKYYLNDETAEIAQNIFENKELRALFDVQRDMSPEDLKALHNMALALKRKERGSDE